MSGNPQFTSGNAALLREMPALLEETISLPEEMAPELVLPGKIGVGRQNQPHGRQKQVAMAVK